MKSHRPPDRAPLAEIATSETQRLARDPNVALVGIGLKFVGGRPMLEAALQYHVRTKLASEEEIRGAGSEPVPREIAGYKTDVLEWVMTRRAACPGSSSPTGDRGGSQEDPLVGGTSTTVLGDFHSLPTGYGTLGGICFDTESGSAMALSNAHVYGDDLANDAIQPWLPTSEYLEASVKYLFCGGPLAHLFFWTAPSPLTAILTAAAAGAWVAAVASDAEDPSRWGQRTGPVPSGGAQTERERIHLEAEVPHLPFPGRDWKAKTHWDYTRVTTTGSTTSSIDAERPNEHVLVGKRVFTDRERYASGERVTICAQLWTRSHVEPVEHFVVAHSFPLGDPERVVKRVLTPSDLCARHDRALEKDRKQTCIRGFTPQVEGVAQMSFPILEPPFVLFSEAGSTRLAGPGESGNPEAVPALRLAAEQPVNVACPPSTHVEVYVFHTNQPVRAIALSANGTQVDQATSTGEQRVLQTLRLTGPEIVRIVVEGGGGEGYLVGICVDERMIQGGQWKAISRYYRGSFDLGLREPVGRWGVVVVAQTLDDTPNGGDPVAAARRLGGIVDSANIVETGECACTILLDHTFEVV